MSELNLFDQDPAFAKRVIRKKIREVHAWPQLTIQDREDFEQDLYRRVVEAQAHFDPNKANSFKFVATIVTRELFKILRRRRAKKRLHNSSSLRANVESSLDKAKHGTKQRTERELVELALDVRLVMNQLPPHLRKFLEIRSTASLSETSRILNKPRSTLNYWMREARRRFEQKNLHEYLEF